MNQKFKSTIKSLLALFLLFCIACKKSKPIPTATVLELSEAEKARLPLLYKDYTISTDEAIAEALSLMPSTARRSVGVSSVKTYKILPNHARSAEDSLSAFHVVNFAEHQGFVIIAGDRRIEQPVFAFVEQGNLIQDSINPGLALFLEMSHAYALQEIESKEQLRDSIYLQLKEKLGELPVAQARPATQDGSSFQNHATTYYGAWYDNQRVELKGRDGQWLKFGQYSPFNNYVPKDCGYNKAPAGCVAVAMAQIMAYYQYPYGRNWANILNWENLYTYPNYYDFDIASLMRDIGQAVKMDYGCGNGGSGAYSEDAIRVFKNWGYSATGLMNFNAGGIISQVRDYRRLVYMRGYASRWYFLGIPTAVYDDGHAWVADGYLQRARSKMTCYGGLYNNCNSTSYQYADFLHLNWGYSGHQSGYFVPGVFDIYSPANVPGRGGEYNFQYNVEYANVYH